MQQNLHVPTCLLIAICLLVVTMYQCNLSTFGITKQLNFQKVPFVTWLKIKGLT